MSVLVRKTFDVDGSIVSQYSNATSNAVLSVVNPTSDGTVNLTLENGAPTLTVNAQTLPALRFNLEEDSARTILTAVFKAQDVEAATKENGKKLLKAYYTALRACSDLKFSQ